MFFYKNNTRYGYEKGENEKKIIRVDACALTSGRPVFNVLLSWSSITVWNHGMMPAWTNTKPEYITPTGLSGKRGWTDTIISKLLGDPDRTAPNPHYRSAHEMRLYLLERVMDAENSDEFVKYVSDLKRKESAKKAVRTKINRIIQWAKTVKIEYDFPNSNRLYGSEREKVNYLRHECTEYAYTLADMYGKTGKDIAYPIIKNRILAEIAKRYHDFAKEATRHTI